MENNPVISIIVPCYNQAEYLPDALQSVMEQKFNHWECIIVNDGSPDNTRDIVVQWLNRDSRFKYLEKENGGLASTRNYGIHHAKGKYILPLDADDKISPDYIQLAVKALDINPSIRLVYSKVMLFGAREGEFDVPPYSYDRLIWKNMIVASAIYRKEDFINAGGYNPNMKEGWEDWDFWLSLLKKEDVVLRLPGFHFFYRIKVQSMVAGLEADQKKKQRLYWQIFENHKNIYKQYESYIPCYLELEKIKNSRQYKLGCMLMNPFSKLRKLFNK